MQDYRCYFLNGRGHILFPADIGAEGLEAAKQHCFAILEESVSSLPERRVGSRSGKGMSCCSDRRRAKAPRRRVASIVTLRNCHFDRLRNEVR